MKLVYFGLIALIGVLFKFYQTLCHGIKISADKKLSVSMIAFVSGMTGFLVQSMFDNTWYNNRIILIFWIFVGLAMACKNFASQNVEER